MDDKHREHLIKMRDYHAERVYNALDPEEVSKATADWQKAEDLVLKYDIASDTHDENIEKIVNAQMNEEIRRDNEIEMENMKMSIEAKRHKKEFWLNFGLKAGTVLLYAGAIVFSFYFDGKGVIFTSNVGRQTIPSATKKLADSFKI